LKSSTNPHFRSKYADLSACIEAVVDSLNENGIMLMQVTHEAENGVMIETLFLHESGEQMSAGKLFMPATKIDAQGFGSALSYARRYSLMAACGIAPEDDDANSAVKNIQAAPYKATPKPAAPQVPPPKADAAAPETNAAPPPPVQKPIPPALENTAPPVPPKMQGSADQWQLKVTSQPGTNVAEWIEVIKASTVFALEMAQTQTDVMTIFRTNRNVFDRLQATNKDEYENLMGQFKIFKEKLNGQ
jgi:hypothetical protein